MAEWRDWFAELHAGSIPVYEGAARGSHHQLCVGDRYVRFAGQLAYGSNKEALRGLTKIAAKEWGQYGICVNIVLPGAESPAAKAWAEKFPEEYAKQVNLNPMKRFGDPEKDIAPVIAFLAGPDSCYFSGQSVIVDGANSIMP